MGEGCFVHMNRSSYLRKHSGSKDISSYGFDIFLDGNGGHRDVRGITIMILSEGKLAELVPCS
jgi:hypothetical protein